ncbi:MAG: hypothetical protein M3083_18940 [Actinomycetota bacterium]|nr:hypothetical protein [Actinomycetota bacterium]
MSRPRRGGHQHRAPTAGAGRVVPGGAEAIRAERRATRQGMSEPVSSGGTLPGAAVVRSAWAGTVGFAVVTVLAAVVPSARIPAVVVDLVLLLAGTALYLWGWAVAAGRSRAEEISLWNLILLQDIAPRPVRVRLLGALAVQVIVAAATCWITAALAFGWLVPMWGLAHCEYWSARYGAFLPRKTEGLRRHRG